MCSRQFQTYLHSEKFVSLINVPEGANDNKSAVGLVNAWCREGDKPLPDPVLSKSCGMNVGLILIFQVKSNQVKSSLLLYQQHKLHNSIQ